jgi:non-ribosomal peptide synthetase component F
VGNRPRHETEGLIGLFLNTLVLQTDLSGDPTFLGLLERVREVTLDAFDHQDLPFEKLVAAISPGRNLFQVLFLVQNMRVAPLDLPGIKVGSIDYPTERVQFELAFTAYEWDGRLLLAVPYSTDLFDLSTIRRMLDHAGRLLEHMVDNPGSLVAEAPILSATELQQILLEWAPPLLDPQGRPVPIGVIGEVGGRRARRRPDGSLEEVVDGTSDSTMDAETLEARLDRRQQEVSDRMDKLSPERRAALRKLIRKG